MITRNDLARIIGGSTLPPATKAAALITLSTASAAVFAKAAPVLEEAIKRIEAGDLAGFRAFVLEQAETFGVPAAMIEAVLPPAPPADAAL